MRLSIGCSVVSALAVFVITLLVSLCFRDLPWSGRIGMATVVAFIVSTAVFLLSLSDQATHAAVQRSVRSRLLSGDDTSDDDFVAVRVTDDAPLLIDVRHAIAEFYGTPATKIGREVRLVEDLCVTELEPSFQFSVVDAVVRKRLGEPKPFAFSMAGLATIDDLAAAIRAVLEDQSNTD